MPDILAAFTGIKKAGAGWTAKCPAHEDRRASLSIGQGDNGRWLLTCHAGCSLDAILAAVNLETSDLFPQKGNGPGRHIVATYDYRDVRGELQYQVVRYEPKDFRQRRPDGNGGWIWNTRGVAPLVYRRQELQGREAAIVPEGEKDVDRLWALGLPGTCNSGGAGKWKQVHTEQLVAAGVKRVVVIPDADTPGQTHGQVVARSCVATGLAVKIMPLPDGVKDVSAYLDAGGTKTDVLTVIKDAPLYEPSQAESPDPDDRREREPGAGPPDVETTLAQCDLAEIPTPPSPANMATLEQGLRQLRTALNAADPLRIAAVRGALVVKCQAAKVPSPAALIDSALAPLKQAASEQNANDLELFPIDDPWPDPVDGAVLLDDLGDVIRQHVVLPPGADIAIPLWCLHTHLMDCWDVSPFLLISSPVWRCGKSTLADFVAGLSHRSLISSNTSDAALFRCIEKFAPTLILDEADSWIKLRDELRGILNSGHKRSGAKVLRADGDTHEPRVFSTWAPKVLALIGRPPATIGDRSVAIPMRRKTKQERVKRIREKKLRALCEPLRRQSARWAGDHRGALSTAEPVLPDDLTDRAQDNWAALMAIADEVGGSWPQAVRDSAKLLSNGTAQEESTQVDLLFDIRSIFDEESPADDFLPTETILTALCLLEDRPWAAWGRQKKDMTPQALASQLKPFGPKPRDKRVGGPVRKGYDKADFLESWERYEPVAQDPAIQAATSQQVNENGGKPGNPVRNTPPDVADTKTAVGPMNTGLVAGVADRKQDPGEENEKLRSDGSFQEF